MSLRVLVTITRRELASFFYAPIAYVVGVAFFALSGLSFWALMQALSDPSQPAAPGAVLRGFFGGTMLHWLVAFALVALLSMRSVAEDRRSGIWEATLTTRAGVTEVLVGKWIALLVFYLLLWLPTIAFIGVLNHYLPNGAALDWGPIAASYLGVAVIGAAMLAVGVAFSTATENQVVAAVATFAALLSWLMLGELADVPPGINLRDALEAAGRGELRLDALSVLGGLCVFAITCAVAISAHGRHARLPGWLRALLVLVIVSSLATLAIRHNHSWDVTANRANSLQAETRRLLKELDAPTTLVLVRPQEAVFDSVFDEVRRLLARMQKVQPLISIADVDPLTQPEEVARWSYELAIRREDVESGGAIVVQSQGRSRSVDLLAMASFSADDLGVGSLEELRAEGAVRSAIALVHMRGRETLCVTTSHGELSAEAGAGLSPHLRWERSVARVLDAGMAVREVSTLAKAALEGCDAVVVMGPTEPLGADEVLALEAYQQAGGSVLVALRSLPVGGEPTPPRSGLELLLEQSGVRVLSAAVVDPGARLEIPVAWLTYDGYGEHSITADFVQRRATIWQAPLALLALREGVTALVEASSEGYAEYSLRALHATGQYEKSSDDDENRVVAVAVETPKRGRLVVFGSAEAFSTLWSERGIGGNERLLASSLQWLVHRQEPEPSSSALRPERIRLLMSTADVRVAFVWCVLVGPISMAFLGAALWWWRRREDFDEAA